MNRPIAHFGLALALFALAGHDAAASDLVVVEAHGVRLAPGQAVDGSKPLSLADGQQVTLLSSTGQILKLEGPSETAPDSQVQGRGDQASAVSALLTERQARTSEVGVVRGETTVKLPDPWVVDVTHPGTSCVTYGRPVVLWRSEDLGQSQVAISPADRSWTVSGSWPAAADRLQMPANLPLRDHTSYVINVGGKMAPVTMRLIPAAVDNDVMRASWMAEVGCDNQANALLAMLKK
ncbi:MAG TPA: hypothetical protein VN802_11255 [Stellaceae bacterium]|nr:hypothetical protein [Stellaceae bacterium]